MSVTKTGKQAGRKIEASTKSRAPGRKKSDPKAKVADEGDFMTRAWHMELEAVERYSTLADAMEEHNNPEVAELFRKLSRIEQLHADQILAEHLPKRPPLLPPGGIRWDAGEGPETADPGALHYRMQPYHALQIALAGEQRAWQFFSKVARSAILPAVRKAAREMAAEEAEHVHLIEDWLKRTPVPDRDWENDPDPPVQSD
jgi:rubrerythrin